VLAAGVGARFGGDKTLEPVGPAGEVLFDYGVFDAWRAGFSRVVFVVRPEAVDAFRASVGSRYEGRMEVRCVEQRIDDLPPGVAPPADRVKPWGTAHAVLTTAGEVEDPFAVANADDFYGSRSWAALAEHLSRAPAAEGALVAFRLRDTLPSAGAVSRALCEVDGSGRLRSIVEAEVERTPGGLAARTAAGGGALTGDERVSMNLWGLPVGIVPALRKGFARFLARAGGSTTAEYLLPSIIDTLVREQRLEVAVLETADPWLGITRRGDVGHVARRLRELVASGSYPSPLWE
jgi:hypothetical protein